MTEDQTERPSPGTTSLSYRVREAVALIRSRTSIQPKVAIVLGSGLGNLADEVTDAVAVPYAEIPHFMEATVAGHAGTLVLGHLNGVPVVVMRGRLHYYEGYTLQQVTFPVRVMRRLGADVLIVTNAAGGLDPRFAPGDLMLITDHLNIMGMVGLNPLVGVDEPELGVRFLDLLNAYDQDLQSLAREAAAERGIQLMEGVYAMVAGPTYETRAEIAFLQHAGAHAVGMSTIPEVIVARHEQMRVLGISAITDVVVGRRAVKEVTHAEVLAVAERTNPKLISLVRSIVSRLA